LRSAGLRIWFDKWCMLHGVEVQKQIEDGLDESKAIAVFVGESGLGPWEEAEFRAAFMDRIRDASTPVIPVLLPRSEKVYPTLPPFLRTRSYVSFQGTLDDHEALVALIAGAKGLEPDSILLGVESLSPDERPIDIGIIGALKRNTIRAYNEIAEKFTEKWFNHPPVEILELLHENLPKKSRILDAGCGPGHHAAYLAKRGHEVAGIDLSSAMLDIARKSTNGIAFTQIDMQHPDFPRHSFDAVWCAGAGVHIPREELLSQLYVFKRVLRKPGLLGLNLQIERKSEIAEDGRFFEFYRSKEEIAHLLAYVGFDILVENYGETKRNTHDLDLTLKWITFYCRP